MCKTINCFSEFIQEILDNNHNKIKEDNSRLKDGDLIYLYEKNEFLYRGQSDESYELIPSIARGRQNCFDTTVFDEERNLIEMAKFKMPNVFNDKMSSIELLALLQHHGIYTRLLDVTESPLVALYFACCSNPKNDGEFFIFKNNNIQITNYPIINAIANTYKIMIPSLEMSLNDFYNQAVIKGFLDSKNEIDSEEWISNCCSTPFFIYAPILSLRQQIQRGRYILFPNKIDVSVMAKDKKAFVPNIEPIKKDDKCIVNRFIIPAKAKQQMLFDLRTFGICKEVLFCDNTDIVCQEIVNDYR